VFVLVADPQGQILDSKEYLAPIITPHEAMLAFAPPGEGQAGEWDERKYRLDFEGVLEQGAGAGGGANAEAATAPAGSSRRAEPRFSLLSGGYAGGGGGGGSSSGSDEDGAAREASAAGHAAGSALALHAQQALQVTVAPQGRSDLVEARSAADYLLHKRTWQGVEAPLVGAAEKAVVAAAEGRTGRAAGYVDEPTQPLPAAAEQQ
jgi:diphthamide biosynthesis protein 2